MEPLLSSAVPFPATLPPITLNPISATTILLAAAIAVLLLRRTDSKIPHANPPGWFSTVSLMQVDAAKRGMEIFENARKQFPGRTFRMISTTGEVIVLPTRYAHSIRNEEKLNFAKSITKDFQADVPGLQPFQVLDHPAQVLQNVARKPLTKLLNIVTEPLASETIFATDLIFGNSTEWKETPILDSILDLIARLSSRVFLGDRLCRNKDWLEVTKEYTRDGFQAALQLSLVPGIFKFLVPIFSPQMRDVRSKMRRAQQLIKPVVEERHVLKEQARKAGQPAPSFNDAIEWAEVESQGVSYDPASFQLFLSFAAIHTTSDLLSKIMLLLAREPELIKPLREEMARVLKEHGWSKIALFNMKLVDSAMKEAQRLRPNGRANMLRRATGDVYLKEEGITIKKGEQIIVEDSQKENPTMFENPEKFDIYRWYRMREDRNLANKVHFVSTSPDHLAFGHGMHACPGRFFAANEIKIALCFLLLKYDWELAPGTNTEPITFGLIYNVNPKSTLRYRSREAEIDLEALKFE